MTTRRCKMQDLENHLYVNCLKGNYSTSKPRNFDHNWFWIETVLKILYVFVIEAEGDCSADEAF